MCGGNFNSSYGTLTSPGYPLYHPPHLNCKWSLSIWPRHYLNVTIKYINITTSSECSTNYLRPAHGHFRNKKRLCGHYEHIQYILHGSISRTYFRFYSETPSTAIQYSGFSLYYQQVPVTAVTLSQLKIVSVNGTKIDYKTKFWV